MTDTAGWRPASLAEPRAPGVQRHTVEHIANFVRMVQILEVRVPLVVLGGGARPNLAANRGAGVHGRHGAGDRSAKDPVP